MELMEYDAKRLLECVTCEFCELCVMTISDPE